jgi:DNA-binding IclR family transcriptional regulator
MPTSYKFARRNFSDSEEIFTMHGSSINSITRAISILECFAYGKKEWNILELAKELSLPPSTMHRQLATLVKHGYLRQGTGDKRYKIGNNLIALASAIMSKNDLRRLSMPEIRKLSEDVGETVHLCQLEGFNMYYVDKVESSHSVSCTSQIGARIPAHTAAAGKALLSGLTDAEIDRYCDALTQFPVFTKNTIREAETLRKAIEAIRRDGYALDDEEREEGLSCTAAPIKDIDGKILAAVSISGPSFRIKPQIRRYIDKINQCAKNISRLMGFNGLQSN